MTTTQIITMTTQAGYRYGLEIGRCLYCHGRIERVVGRSGPWMHESTTRTVCLLPADTSKVATPV